MSEFVAGLPMYDWPETRAEVDAEWVRLREALRKAGVDSPEAPVRKNADLPAVPGGIRDGRGRVIAPDPATLPPDGLDFSALWLHPKLLFAQTCWGPMEQGLSEHVAVVGQPSYDGIEGGQGENYSSAILMSRTTEQNVRVPQDGTPLIPLDLVRGGRLAYNGPDSMSGIVALTRDLQAMGESIEIFRERIETGSHRASIVAVAEGSADVCAIDCRSWMLARRHEPRAADMRVVGWTALRKGLPYVASARLPEAIRAVVRQVLDEFRRPYGSTA
jgi:ABC-type phosphate/phosphonate transport system substrate-binding protein